MLGSPVLKCSSIFCLTTPTRSSLRARRELALRYVAQPHIALTEVAFLLGYSELSAFSRAFRQWTGMSPVRYRRHRSGRGAAVGSELSR